MKPKCLGCQRPTSLNDLETYEGFCEDCYTEEK